jgi:hypothetical protein
VVQTTGTWTDTVDINQYIIDKILDSCIDDVFGYQLLGDKSVSRRVPTNAATSATGLEFAVQRCVEIPGNLLQILNKESETERLQSLFFGVVGNAITASQVIHLKWFTEIHFVGVAKKIILR